MAIVDGLWGPWQEAEAAIDAMYANLRAILADQGAVDPAPPSGLDPRTKHGYGVNISPAFAERFWGSVTCPLLAVETPASTTPPQERAERLGWFGGPTTLAEVDDASAAAVVATVVEWHERLPVTSTSAPVHGP